VPGQGIENEGPRSGKYGLGRAKREERADTPAFTALPRNLEG
jgi:hypothetical protein